jgi:hypothetical protein
LGEIRVIITEESYTSKCSFLDNQLPGKQAQYLGKRVERELCRSQLGISINTDEKGCAQSVRKVFPDAVEAQGIQAVVGLLRSTPDELKAVRWAGSPTYGNCGEIERFFSGISLILATIYPLKLVDPAVVNQPKVSAYRFE